MKRKILALFLVVSLTLVSAQGVIAATKKKLTPEDIAKKMEKAKLNTGKGSIIDPSVALTLEALRKPTDKKRNIKDKLDVLKNEKAAKELLRVEAEKKAREAALEMVKIGEKHLPGDLFELYTGTTFVNTTQETLRDINALVSKGGTTLSNSVLETKLQPLFDTAAKDSSDFAAQLLKKYSLQSLVNTAIMKPESLKDVKNAVKKEMEEYAKQELNKLANEVVRQIIPELELLTIDFTKLDSKNLKASLRSMAVNALSQSYLGPGYVALYIAFEMLFPKEAAKVHAELRRFDKKYLQPYAHAYEDAITTAVDKYTAELKRVGKRVEKEVERAGKRVEKEAKREAEDVKKEVKRAEKKVKKAAKKIKKKLKF